MIYHTNLFIYFPECDQTFVSRPGGPQNGTFSAPVLQNPTNHSRQCLYIFLAGPGQRVEVLFTSFNLRGTPPEWVNKCSHCGFYNYERLLGITFFDVFIITYTLFFVFFFCESKNRIMFCSCAVSRMFEKRFIRRQLNDCRRCICTKITPLGQKYFSASLTTRAAQNLNSRASRGTAAGNVRTVKTQTFWPAAHTPPPPSSPKTPFVRCSYVWK